VAAACSGSLRRAVVGNRAINRADLSQKSEYAYRSDKNVVVSSGTASFHSDVASTENPAAARMPVRLGWILLFAMADIHLELQIAVHRDSKSIYLYHLIVPKAFCLRPSR